MFLEFYGLREQPFGVTPDPRFLFLSRAHREALASLYYGIEAGRGFLGLVAKPGMGKTTLLFHLLEKFRRTARTAFLFQTQCNSREFLRFLLLEMGCDSSNQDFVRMHEEFNNRLLQESRAGRRFIVVIDEAQNLDASVLETVRLLSDFETPQAKLLQIILVGQLELAAKIASPGLAQLRQRISMVTGLDALSPQEVGSYIDHRLRVAGYSGESLFTPESQAMIAELSEGVPRNINNYCFNALSVACALERKTVDASIIQEVAADLDFSRFVSEPAEPQDLSTGGASKSAPSASPGNPPASVSGGLADEPSNGRWQPVSPGAPAAFAPAMPQRPARAVNPAVHLAGAETESQLGLAEARAYVTSVARMLRNRQRIVDVARS